MSASAVQSTARKGKRKTRPLTDAELLAARENGASYKVLADKLGVKIATVRVLLRRAARERAELTGEEPYIAVRKPLGQRRREY